MRKKLSNAGLRARLIAVVLIAIIPAFGLSAYNTIIQRKDAAHIAERDAMHLVRLAAKEQQRLIESTQQLLISVSKVPKLKELSSVTNCRRTLLEVLQPYPYYRNFGYALPNGTVYCRTLPTDVKVNITDRSYFQRAMHSRGFGVGDYQIGRASQKSSINFGQAILSEKGDIVAVVFAALNLEWLNQLISDNKLPPASTLTVVDGGGTVLAHHPESEKWVGRSIQNTPIFGYILDHAGEGTARGYDSAGVQRLYAFAPLHDSPSGRVYVAVGIPESVAFAVANEGFVRNTALLLLVAALTGVAAWFGSDALVLRKIKAFAKAAHKLGAGILTARTELPHGNDELGQLAATFDGMATNLQQAHEDLEDRVALRTRQLEEAYQAEGVRTLADPLTGLPNRLLFNDRLTQALAATEQRGMTLAVVLIDIDGFRATNESHGHGVGDTVLKTLGARLRANAPSEATVARFGGDEFALIITAQSQSDVLDKIRVLHHSTNIPIDTGVRVHPISASFGIAFFGEHGRSARELLHSAELALLSAKRRNNGVQIYASGTDLHLPSRLALAEEVHAAVTGDAITLHYQPKFDYASNDISGAVATARWHHSRHGILKPNVFMPLIEECGLQKALTQRVLTVALDQVAKWHKQGIRLPVAVKIDGESFLDAEFCNIVRGVLLQHEVAPEFLSLEIDENTLVLSPTRVREILSQLHHIGIAMTVRNFGSVHGGSIGWIGSATSAITDVKISCRYVLDMPNNQNYFTYVQALIDVAHALKLKIGADGVESDAIWSELKTLGCDYAVGYFLRRPVTADEFGDWYARRGAAINLQRYR